MAKPTFWGLLRKVHRDQGGSVSLETILIIGAVALPVLIFLVTRIWPRIQTYFEGNLQELESGADSINAS